ncbi:hypothetical protein E2C01_096176 [Portunus trituberculatus]|uniref:Uncharacterized protein n=1 Tax=Portunus trituberculatus TaxID=210409 RepID=A0A5B7K1D5_PORTR|nr:hypothetical protein [Portunus trituberculatus]
MLPLRGAPPRPCPPKPRSLALFAAGDFDQAAAVSA